MTGMRREPRGLYDPANEHDACGVGFVANIRGEKSHDVVHEGVQVLCNLEHRGACGCDPETGDGAGLPAMDGMGSSSGSTFMCGRTCWTAPTTTRSAWVNPFSITRRPSSWSDPVATRRYWILLSLSRT